MGGGGWFRIGLKYGHELVVRMAHGGIEFDAYMEAGLLARATNQSNGGGLSLCIKMSAFVQGVSG